jgi:transcriptional regulator with XRE-family HTH domain
MTLQEWMIERDMSDTQLAKVLGINRSMVYRLRLGQRAPSLRMMEQIAVASGGAVLPNDWSDFAGDS